MPLTVGKMLRLGPCVIIVRPARSGGLDSLDVFVFFTFVFSLSTGFVMLPKQRPDAVVVVVVGFTPTPEAFYRGEEKKGGLIFQSSCHCCARVFRANGWVETGKGLAENTAHA